MSRKAEGNTRAFLRINAMYDSLYDYYRVLVGALAKPLLTNKAGGVQRRTGPGRP